MAQLQNNTEMATTLLDFSQKIASEAECLSNSIGNDDNISFMNQNHVSGRFIEKLKVILVNSYKYSHMISWIRDECDKIVIIVKDKIEVTKILCPRSKYFNSCMRQFNHYSFNVVFNDYYWSDNYTRLCNPNLKDINSISSLTSDVTLSQKKQKKVSQKKQKKVSQKKQNKVKKHDHRRRVAPRTMPEVDALNESDASPIECTVCNSSHKHHKCDRSRHEVTVDQTNVITQPTKRLRIATKKYEAFEMYNDDDEDYLNDDNYEIFFKTLKKKKDSQNDSSNKNLNLPCAVRQAEPAAARLRAIKNGGSIHTLLDDLPPLNTIQIYDVPSYDTLINFERTPKCRSCVMCGKHDISVKKQLIANNDTAVVDADDGSGTVANIDDNVNIATNEALSADMVVIPKQNKSICNLCDSKIWKHNTTSVYFKWCKSCKRFHNIHAFSEKLKSVKCDISRARGRESYKRNQDKLTNVSIPVDYAKKYKHTRDPRVQK